MLKDNLARSVPIQAADIMAGNGIIRVISDVPLAILFDDDGDSLL